MNDQVQTPDKIDGALQRYFEKEMPKPWPAFTYPQASPFARPARSTRTWMSRLALAASVALLFVGYWSLSQLFPGPATPSEAGFRPEGPVIGGGITIKTPRKANVRPNVHEQEDGGMGKVEKILPGPGRAF